MRDALAARLGLPCPLMAASNPTATVI
jgi:hypothetical protein